MLETRRRSSGAIHMGKVRAVWELPTLTAYMTLATMLGDLVVLHAIKQRTEAAEKKETATADKEVTPVWLSSATFGQPDELAELRENFEWEQEPLTPEQTTLIEKFKNLGIEGLRLHYLPARWNCSFVRFSPFSSFLKKAGFESMKDVQFQRLVRSLTSHVLVTHLQDGTIVLLPSSLEILDDPSFKRPSNISIGIWLRRRSMGYLNQAINDVTLLHQTPMNHSIRSNSISISPVLGYPISDNTQLIHSQSHEQRTRSDYYQQHITLPPPPPPHHRKSISGYSPSPPSVSDEMIQRLRSVETVRSNTGPI